MKTDVVKIEGPLVAGLNGAFAVELPMSVNLYFGGAPFRMAGMTHLERVGSPLYRVKCATEVAGTFEEEVPAQDFGVPTHTAMRLAVTHAVEAAFQGRPVFAGCVGGIGRTGTFLAVVLKVFYPTYSGEQLVYMTRAVYLGHAIETAEQKKLIDTIDVSALQRRVKWLWMKAVLRKLLGGDFSPLLGSTVRYA
jgi:hypothetical protein